jgi:putative nucleotidyltransferase with HDIG domain
MEEQALKIVKKLKMHGFEAVYAGGYVRDKLLGINHNDIDIATDATPDIVETLFDNTVSVGKSFGVIIVIQDNCEIEVATFRSDSKCSDGRRPDSVIFSSIQEDAKRRDLTINGMFCNPFNGEIFDYVGGQQDLINRVVRFIGSPEERILEDKLRMLRVIRFAVKLGFTIDSETLKAVKAHSFEISVISKERIQDELLKILKSGDPKRSLNLLYDTGLLENILPEICLLKNCNQSPKWHLEGNVFIHTIKVLENLPEKAPNDLILAALLHDIGKPSTTILVEDELKSKGHEEVGADIAEAILRRLKFDNTTIERVKKMVRNHMRPHHLGPDPSIKSLRKFVRDIGDDLVGSVLDLAHADELGRIPSSSDIPDLSKKLDEIKKQVDIKRDPILNGNEIMGLLGIPTGSEVGRAKKLLLEIEDDYAEKGKNLTKDEARQELLKNFHK